MEARRSTRARGVGQGTEGVGDSRIGEVEWDEAGAGGIPMKADGHGDALVFFFPVPRVCAAPMPGLAPPEGNDGP